MRKSTTGRHRLAAGTLAVLTALGLVLTSIGSCSDQGTMPAPVETSQDRATAAWHGKAFAFSFTSDDGNADNLAWADLYRDFGLRYTIFVTARWIGDRGKLTVNDLRELQADGFEIGGHSLSHPRLTECSDSARVYEMATCRDTLEALIDARGYRCLTFAYPENAHDERVMATARLLYTAARDGGQSATGYPNYSEGRADWDSCSLYEVPTTMSIVGVTGRNSFSEDRTRRAIRSRLAHFRAHHDWVVLAAHKLGDCDVEHMRWILEELTAAGDAWIAPFGEVAGCYRRKIGLPPYNVTIADRHAE